MIDIYIITNKINGMQYVGKTQKGYLERFKQHCISYKQGERTYISCAIHHYGKDNFKVELLQQVTDDTWEYWEQYYIKYYKTHYTQTGYNITWGGDSNPMDIAEVRLKHRQKVSSPQYRERQKELSTGRHRTAETIEKCRQYTLNNLPIVVRGLLEYNESKKVRVGLIDNDVIVKEFSSASDACRFVNRPIKEAGNLLASCDKFTKKGRRVKMFGYSWTRKL